MQPYEFIGGLVMDKCLQGNLLEDAMIKELITPRFILANAFSNIGQ
jgi:hypothetical protein